MSQNSSTDIDSAVPEPQSQGNAWLDIADRESHRNVYEIV